ncbi:MAG: sensor histidine kinase [Oscillospiraceae bacterium]|nr:sensor histidine kinase [Oscillospiraceae bacterium]
MDAKLLYQLIIQVNVTAQMVLAAAFFCLSLVRKRRFGLWLALSLLLAGGVLSLSIGLRLWANNLLTRFLMRIMQFSVPLIFILLCFDVNLSTKLKTWCAGIASMELGAALFSFLLALFRVDEKETISFFSRSPEPIDWVIYYTIHLAIYGAIYYLFGRKSREELDRSSRRSTLVLALVCLLFLTVPDCISNEYRQVSYTLFLVNRIYLLALASFILAICTSIEFQSRYRADMEIMDQVLREERKQYEQIKENMAAVNMKCHDLRHQLDDFSGRLTESEIASLRESMDFYDMNIKTGCEVLDVVIHTAMLSCRAEGIELSCLADGKILNFMRTRHLFSLFNNAVSNAIEAVRKLSDPEKKVISVTVERQGDSALIEVTNYFDGAPVSPGQTSKADRSRHGFGTMSMRYIAKIYGGTLSVSTAGELYCLDIRVPLPRDLLV